MFFSYFFRWVTFPPGTTYHNKNWKCAWWVLNNFYLQFNYSLRLLLNSMNFTNQNSFWNYFNYEGRALCRYFMKQYRTTLYLPHVKRTVVVTLKQGNIFAAVKFSSVIYTKLQFDIVFAPKHEPCFQGEWAKLGAQHLRKSTIFFSSCLMRSIDFVSWEFHSSLGWSYFFRWFYIYHRNRNLARQILINREQWIEVCCCPHDSAIFPFI